MDVLALERRLEGEIAGWPDRLVRAGGSGPVLLAGPGTGAVAHALLGRLLAAGERAVIVDAANGFDAYALARAGRRLGHPAAAWLAAVTVTRAFTWPQLVAALDRKTLAEAARRRARWVVVLGPLDLFADQESVPENQARRGARRTAEALRVLAGHGLGVLVAQDDRPLAAAGRDGLLHLLRRYCAETVVFEDEVHENTKFECIREIASRARESEQLLLQGVGA